MGGTSHRASQVVLGNQAFIRPHTIKTDHLLASSPQPARYTRRVVKSSQEHQPQDSVPCKCCICSVSISLLSMYSLQFPAPAQQSSPAPQVAGTSTAIQVQAMFPWQSSKHHGSASWIKCILDLGSFCRLFDKCTGRP